MPEDFCPAEEASMELITSSTQCTVEPQLSGLASLIPFFVNINNYYYQSIISINIHEKLLLLVIIISGHIL